MTNLYAERRARYARARGNVKHASGLHCRAEDGLIDRRARDRSRHRDRECRLRLGFPPCAGDPDPAARRLRRRRGSIARRLQGRVGAVAARRRARQSARVAGVGRTLQGHRRHPAARPFRRARRNRQRGRSRGRGRGGLGRRRERRRRPPPPDLHVLPPGPRLRCAGGAHAARGVRPDDGGDRAGVSLAGAHAGATHRAREGQDPRRAHSVSGADPRRAARAARRRAARDLPRLQRRLRGVVRRVVDAARSVGGGHPPGAAARRAAAPLRRFDNLRGVPSGVEGRRAQGVPGQSRDEARRVACSR